MRINDLLPGFLIAGFLTSCVPVGPDYVEPDTPVASGFAGAGEQAASPSLDRWWRRLGISELNALVDEALERNLDIAVACENLREARSFRKEAASAFLPRAGTNLAFTRYHFDDSGGGDLFDSGDGSGIIDSTGFFGSPLEFWNAGLDVSWEVDVFGGRRRELQRATANEEASQAALDGVRLATVAEVVDAYVTLAGLREQLRLVEEQVRRETARTQELRERVDAGAIGRTDLDRSISRVENVRMQKPPLEAGIVSQLRRLALLLGRQSSSLDGKGIAANALPAQLPMLRTGFPGELLLRRPDVRQAERRMAAATEAVGVAVANFYPRFSIGGSATGFATSFGDLFNAPNWFLQYGPSVEWSLFSGGNNKALLERADAQQRAAFLEYEKTVLGAVGEVESELANLRAEARRLIYVQRAREASRNAVRQVREKHQAGAVAYIDVLTEEESLRDIEITAVRVKSQMLQVWIRLHKALGGGWQEKKKTG